MTREEAREIAWQEDNQTALLARDVPLSLMIVEQAKALLIVAMLADNQSNGDALTEFCMALEDAIGKLEAAAERDNQ